MGEEDHSGRTGMLIIACLLLLLMATGAALWYRYAHAPTLECLPEIQVEYGEPLSVYSVVTRAETERGSVTLFFAEAEEAGGTEVVFQKTGSYTATVVAEAENGVKTTRSVAVTVVDTTPPELTASDFSVHIGEEINYLSAVSAVDALDGDLTASVTVDALGVKADTPGTYLVSYQVSDSAGNTASARASITILPKAAESLTLSRTETTLAGNGHIQLEAAVEPEDWAGELVWTSSDESVASVTGGLVTWRGAGSATITVQADTLSASCSVTCEALTVSSVRLNRHTLQLEKGEEITLTATLLPSNYTGTVVWTSSNESVATVEDGVVTWAGEGACNIIATVDGVSDLCAVTCGEGGLLDWLLGLLFR